jgi:hypothetical protein
MTELLARSKHPLIKQPLKFLWRFEDLYKSWALSLHFASVAVQGSLQPQSPVPVTVSTELSCLKPVVSVCSTSSRNTFWLERTKTTAFQVGILGGGVYSAIVTRDELVLFTSKNVRLMAVSAAQVRQPAHEKRTLWLDHATDSKRSHWPCFEKQIFSHPSSGATPTLSKP